MVHRLAMICAAVVVAMMLVSTLTFAAEIAGTVSAVNEKGMATIKTTDGKMSCHKLSHKHK